MLRYALLAGILQGCVPHLYSPDDSDSTWVAPANDWPMSTPPGDLEAEGYNVGQVPPDFRMLDQFGQEVSLWQFHGNVLVVDLSALWCAPCQELARHTEEVWQEYKDQGFVYVTVITEDLSSQPPDQADLEQWASTFGITAPIVGDDASKTWSGPPVAGNGGGLPLVLVVDREMRITARLGADDPAIRAAVEAEL